MVVAYFNKQKGVTIATFGALLLIGYQVALRVALLFVEMNPMIEVILNELRVVLFQQELSVHDFFWFLLIFYIYKVVDGFIDGIIMTILDLNLLAFIGTTALINGRFSIFLVIDSIQATLFLDFTLILWLIFLGYLWILFWEIVLIFVKIDPMQKLHRKFWGWVILKTKGEEARKKYEEKIIAEENLGYDLEVGIQKDEKPKKKRQEQKWVDRNREQILFEANEVALNKEWVKAKSVFRKGIFQAYILDTLTLVILGGLYGLVTYLMYEVGGPTYNRTVLAAFFPMWALIIYAGISVANFVRAYIGVYLIQIISLYLLQEGYITLEGLIFVSLAITIMGWFQVDLVAILSEITLGELFQYISMVIGIIMLIQLAVLGLNKFLSNIRGHSKVEFIASTTHIYVRYKHSFNKYDILKNILLILIWPFNFATYRDLVRQVTYTRQTFKESWTWDYGRLSYQDSIRRLKKKEQNPPARMILAGIYIVIGIFLLQFYVGFFVFVLAIWEILKLRKKTGKVLIRFKRRRAEGSAFMLETYNRLRLYQIPRESFMVIPAVQNYQQNLLRNLFKRPKTKNKKGG